MPMNPGNNAVTFNYPGVPNDRLHKQTAVSPSSFSQPGCLMEPVTESDKVSDTAFSEATDKCICPANSSTGTVQAEWFIQFNSDNYRVLGVRPFYDSPWGRLDHYTFMAKYESG